MHLEDPLTAFYFDRAIFTWGSRVEAELNEADNAKTPQGKANKTAIAQQKWLGVSKFADPSQAKKR